MQKKGYLILIVTSILALIIAFNAMSLEEQAESLSPLEELGKSIFFDEMLSDPLGQSCATCHAPEVGFTGPDSTINEMTAVYPGAVPTRVGNRKPPTAAYGGDSPVLYFDEDEGMWLGYVLGRQGDRLDPGRPAG
jgi:cytochrome c peroxidase